MKAKTFLAVLALALALGLALLSCENGIGGGSQTDRALLGTWVSNETFINLVGEEEELWITFMSNGVYETNILDDGWKRGPYSTSGNILTVTISEMYFDAEIASHYNTSVGWKNRDQLTLCL